MPDPSQFNTDRTYPGRWMITFSNPPINMFVPTTIVELGALMTGLEADPSVKVVVFQSANPDFFIAHLDVAKAAERPEMLGIWRDFVLRLSSSPVVSIAKIRGRTRGIGNEFVLACDMRFASRQSALFRNPEVGVGLVPGGGAMEWLPRLVGRSRALEIVLSGDDFDADIAERYGWVNRTLDDDHLDSFVDALVRRLASFDRETLAAAKAQINRFGTPTAAEFQSSNDLFFPLLALPSAQARRAKIPQYRLRRSERLRIELRPVSPHVRAGGRPCHGTEEVDMKPWKAVSLILLALAVAAAGYGLTLVRRGFSALGTPSAIEEFAATTARKMAVPSAYRQLRNPIVPSTENIRGGMEHFSYHCAACHSDDGGGHTVFGKGLYPKPPDLRAAGT